MKKYYPKSIVFYLFIPIPLLIISVGVYTITWFLEKYNKTMIEWFGFLIVVFAIVYFLYMLFRFLKRRIVLFDDKIYVQKDIGGKDTKLQYALDVKFDDIQSIGITVDSNNSHNQYMRFVITPMPNVVLYLKNGKAERINVYYYSKKQTIEIIDYIIGKKKLIDATFENKSGQELIDGLRNVKI